MNRSELFSGLSRGAVHSCGELLYGLPEEERVVLYNSDPEPVQTPAPQPEIEDNLFDFVEDIQVWMGRMRRDHVLHY